MSEKQKFIGKNLEESLAKASNYFSIDKAFICYNILSNSSGGFFSKIFSSKVEIEAWVENVKEDLQEAARKAVQEALAPKPKPKLNSATKPISKPAQSLKPIHKKIVNVEKINTIEPIKPEIMKYIVQFSKKFFDAFSLTPEQTSLDIFENRIRIQIEDEFLESLLTKSDKISLSFEHVLKRLVQKEFGELLLNRVELVAGSSAQKREDRLVGIAKSLALKVQKTGKNVTVASKSSQERRIIHMALDNFPGIGTRSIGVGDKRRLVIFSIEKNQRPSKKQNKNNLSKKKSTLIQIESDKHD